MRYRDLGPIEVADGDGPRPLGGPTPSRILALLLGTPNRPIAAETLTAALWPDRPPERARASLETQVWRLRKALHAPDGTPVRTTDHGYLLHAEPDQIDSHRFATLARWAATLLQQGRAGEAAAVADEALGTWRGPLFGPFGAEPWASARAAEVDGIRAALRETRWAALLASGQADRVVAETAAETGDGSLAERVWELRIHAQAATGHREDALATYQQARRLLADELGIEPGTGLRAAQEAVLAGRPVDSQPALATRRLARGPGALPATLTGFHGRGTDLATVATLLQQHRLVTLVGPGGVGKTRLAVEVAKSTAAGTFDLARFVDLSIVAAGTDGAGLAAAVADALALAGPGDDSDPVDDLCARLDVAPLLLVADNCEHVTAAAGELLTALLAAAPTLRVLATSREPLDVPGEVIWPVRPLTDDAAAHLLSDRLAHRPGAASPGEHPAEIAAICAGVANLPLGLELAAARARTFTLADVAASLAHEPERVAVTTGPARQRSLTATVDWSHAQLGADEQALYRRLSAFPAVFDLADVEAVCAFGTVARRGVDAVLSSLVQRSLVSAAATGDPVLPATGRSWFRLLEPIRQHAEAQLAGSGEDREVRALLTSRVAARIVARPGLGTADRAGWYDDMDRAWPTVRAGLPALFADSVTGLPAIAGLAPYWILRRLTGQAVDQLAALAAAADEACAVAAADPTVALLAHGAYAAAQAYRQQPEPPGDPDLQLGPALCAVPLDSPHAAAAAELAVALALTVWAADRHANAAAIADLAAERSAALGLTRLALAARGTAELCQTRLGGDSATVLALAEQRHGEAVAGDAVLAVMVTALAAALATRALRRYQDSARWATEQLRAYLAWGGHDLTDPFEHQACLLTLAEHYERAAYMFGAAATARTQAGLRGYRFGAQSQALAARARTQLGERRYHDAHRAGQRADPDETCGHILQRAHR